MKYLIMVFLFSQQLLATEFCVTNTTEFRQALSFAVANNANDIIKVALGYYPTEGTPFFYNNSGGWDLDISGGWTGNANDPCDVQIKDQPFGTLIDGESTTRGLDIAVGNEANVSISHMAFFNGYVGGFDRGGGLYFIRFFNLYEGSFSVAHCVFIGNEANYGSALMLGTAETISISNNLFSANHARIGQVLEAINPDELYFYNNTVLNNTTDGNVGGVYLSSYDPSLALVANNVFWDNQGVDLRLDGTRFFVKNNNIEQYQSGAQLEEVDNISLPPRFELLGLMYVPGEASPIINKGIKPCTICPFPVPFDELWVLPDQDLRGLDRVQNGVVDIGATESPYEQVLIFWDRFE